MRTFLFLVAGLWFPSLVFGLDGGVVRVVDGDTIVVLTDDKTSVKVRLSYIDSPEKSQPLGKKAKQVLSGLVLGQVVHIVEQPKPDRWKRVLGVVFVNDGLNVNREMVALGYAWVYPKYNQDADLPAFQLAAQRAGLGLWRLQADQRIEPWVWRKLARQSRH